MFGETATMTWSAPWNGLGDHRGLLPLGVLVVVGHLYTLFLVGTVTVGRSRLLAVSPFTTGRYYALMGWAPLTFVVLAVAVDARFLLFALVAAVAGIVGETLLGLVWGRFFALPIWTYGRAACCHGRTATINLLPWMVGALLFVSTGRLFGLPVAPAELSLGSPMVVSALTLAVGLVLSWALLGLCWPAERRARRFTAKRFGLFCLPIATTALGLSIVSSPRYAPLMLAFAIVGTATEYAYGRTMSLFFGERLWTYHHLPVDGGHSSLCTLPLWALGGLYFFWLGALLGLA